MYWAGCLFLKARFLVVYLSHSILCPYWKTWVVQKAVYFCHVSSFFCSTPLLTHEGLLLPKNGVRHSSLWKGTRLEKGM